MVHHEKTKQTKKKTVENPKIWMKSKIILYMRIRYCNASFSTNNALCNNVRNDQRQAVFVHFNQYT